LDAPFHSHPKRAELARVLVGPVGVNSRILFTDNNQFFSEYEEHAWSSVAIPYLEEEGKKPALVAELWLHKSS
jgi:hypothetical protein